MTVQLTLTENELKLLVTAVYDERYKLSEHYNDASIQRRKALTETHKLYLKLQELTNIQGVQ